MQCAVTGASGHVGANLVRELLARGHRVRALVRSDRRALEGLDIELAQGDLHDPSSLRVAFDGAEVVFHAAAHVTITGSDGGMTESTNVDGVGRATAAAVDAGVRRFVHFSSVHAFEHVRGGTVDESSRRATGREFAAYDRSKFRGEQVVRAAASRGLDVVIVNPAAVLGPHDYKPSRMGQVLLALAHGKLPGLVAGGFDWVDARDVALGAIAAAEKGQPGENYILSGEWRSMAELAGLFATLTGVRAPRMVSPVWLARAALPLASVWAQVTRSRPLFTRESLDTVERGARCSHAKAARELGYSPRPLEDTLRDALEWYRGQGWIAESREPSGAHP